MIKGLVARGELPKGLVAEYSGRAHSKGKVGGSWAFPENSKAVYPEQRKPKRGKSRGGGPGSGCNLLTYVVPSSGPAHDTGILIQETNKKKKKKSKEKFGPYIVQKALQVILISSQVWNKWYRRKKKK